MSKAFFTVILTCFLFVNAYAQKSEKTLLFINPAKGKIIKGRVGNQLSVKYYGYLGQVESFKQTISLITDSSVFLGVYLPDLTPEQSERMTSLGLGYKEIMLRDITTFRRMSIGRTLLKSSLSIGALIGGIFILNDMYENSKLSTGAKFGISFGVGLGTTYLINVFVSDRPKYSVKDGWRIETLK